MFSKLRLLSCLIVSILFFTTEAKPQKTDFESILNQQDDSLKVGLVLSGGGALGIAHIGIIQAIEEAGVRIDYITGTSMGSLIGGLYAIGYTSDQLAEMATSNNFIEMFSEKPSRKYISNFEKITNDRTIATFPISEKRIDLPGGIISGQNVYTYLSRLTRHVHATEEFSDLPIPFAAVATDLETGTAKVFKSGYLPDALRASISIPSLFSPHKIEDKLYVDGGLIRNLPVEDAIEMGANYTIAVDVSSPLMSKDSLNTLTSVLNQSIYFRIHDYADIQRQMADYVIRIDELKPYSAADFNYAEMFLKIGQTAGERHLEEFKKIAARQKYGPSERTGVMASTSIPIDNVVVQGNNIYDDTFILNQLNFIPGSILEQEIIEEKIYQLYSSQYIDHVTYRLMPVSDASDTYYTLHITVEENNTDEFKIGLRYETGSQASILLEGYFQNLIHNGSMTRFESRLGNRINFQADHLYNGGLGSNLALLASVQYLSEKVDWFSEKDRISQFKNEVVRAEFSGGNYFSIQNLISLGIRKDFTFHTNRINRVSIEPSEKDYHSVFFRFIRDKLNRRSYPTAGYQFVLENHYSNEVIFSDINFTSSDLYYNGYYPIKNNLSLTNTLWLGYTTGRDLPWGYWKSPNRFDPVYDFIRFGGAEPYQISTRNIQLASIGFQYEPFYHRFLGLDFYAGRFLDNWNLNAPFEDIEEMEYGVSFSVGALTILGPIKVIFSRNTLSNVRAELQIGYQF